MKALRIVVRGRVQGVGYRAFARREAERLGVAGWVRNRDDGSVEVQAEGRDELVDAFVERLRKGPLGGRVEALDARAVAASGDDGFDVRF